jgi:hypothetical protein
MRTSSSGGKGRAAGHPCREFSDQHSTNTLSWDFVERVTRIELALSAWEAERSRLATGLTCRLWWSGVTVADPSSPWLMARQWHGDHGVMW